jgi:general secretion pathway protein H
MRTSRGLTLIEILVVTFILAIMIGLVALRLTRDDRDLARDEADRLVVVLQSAREEAILRGDLFALELRAEGYRFLRPDGKGKLVTVDDGPLMPRQLPEPMRLRLELEGQSMPGRQGIVFDPSGALPAFNIALTLNDARWWVRAQNNGKICSTWKAACEQL